MQFLGQVLVVLGVLYFIGGVTAIGMGRLPEIGIRSRLGGVAALAGSMVPLLGGLVLVGAVELVRPAAAGGRPCAPAVGGTQAPVAILRLERTEARAVEGSSTRAVQMPVAPLIVNQRIFVPVQFIGQIPGYEVKEEGSGGRVTVRSGNGLVTFVAGWDRALVCQQEKPLPAAPFVENGHLMVPLRFLAEELGGQVLWSEDKNEATIVR